MRKILFGVFLWFFLVVTISPATQAIILTSIWPSEKIPMVHKSVVKVGYGCSGFIVEPGIVITASHCIRRQLRVGVQFYDYKTQPFDVLYQGQPGSETDFAILKGNTRNLPNLVLSKRKPVFLDRIRHYGYGGRPNQWVTPGMYLRNACTSRGCEHYISCSVIPGDSGGAIVMHDTKEVIGVVHSSYWPMHIPVAVVAPASKIIDKLEELRPKVEAEKPAA